MSPADRLIAPAPVPDRRFYPRNTPSSQTHVVLGPEIFGELVNLGENGCRLAAPFELSNNFVCRATLPLDGLERPIEVCVRVIWTSEAKQAGIQFMDLRESDREQIRKWAAVQKKTAARTTETLNAAGPHAAAVMEPETARIQTAAALSHTPKRKNRRGMALTVGAACVAALAVTGIALWASPLGSWVAKSLAARTKSVFAMSKSRSPEGAPVSAPVPQKDVEDSAVVENAVTAKGGAMEPPGVRTADLAANETARPKSTARTDTVKAPFEKKHAPRRKPIAKADAMPVAMARFDRAQDSSNAAPMKLGNDEGDRVATESGDVKINSKPQIALSGGNSARASVAPNAVSPAIAANADFRPPRPAARATAIPEAAPAEPEIIQTPEPASRVVDVMLPNSPRPIVLSVPGERILQSSALTLRIERAIVAPAGQARWTAERKKKVVLGDLLSRVDPRAPHTTEATGSRVSVRAMIGKNGRVAKLMPINGPAELLPRVMRAVREWRFQPTLLDGKPLETAALVTIEFRGPATTTK